MLSKLRAGQMPPGSAKGLLKTGRHVRYAEETPIANLYLSLLECKGVPAAHGGDANGRPERLTDL